MAWGGAQYPLGFCQRKAEELESEETDAMAEAGAGVVRPQARDAGGH